MNRRNQIQINFMVLLTICVSLMCADSSDAQFRMPFKRQKKNARASQDLTVKDGPWLIMCTSFTGENAEQQARLLANELRGQRFKTYIYRQTFDHSLTTTGVGWQIPKAVRPLVGDAGELPEVKLNNPEPEKLRMRTANSAKVQEVAVLVGDFPSPDDNKAQKTLATIKTMKLTSFGERANNTEAETKSRKKSTVKRSKGGALRTAFLLPNPMLPDEYFRREQVDEFVVRINRADNIEHSLLDCEGLYSVRIATFRGVSTFDPQQIAQGESELSALQRAGKALKESGLSAAENNAHLLTKHLRKKGVEAYEFHDRFESYVCIGSFDWVQRESHGSYMNNPEIVRLVNSCLPETKHIPGRSSTLVPRSIEGILLDPMPTPILVPKADKLTRSASRLSFRR